MIRRLERADYPHVVKLLERFAWATEFDLLKKEQYSHEHVQQVLLRCERAGISFVSLDGTRITGCILSCLVPDLWIPEIVRLRELAWFVDKDYQGQGHGRELYKAYVYQAEHWRRQGRITGYTMSKLTSSPQIDYPGFRHVESTYMIGA